jgi:hypothetical protein
MKKDIHVSFRMTLLDSEKMRWLSRHDGTSIGYQYRKAVKKYLGNRRVVVFKNNDPEGKPKYGQDPGAQGE